MDEQRRLIAEFNEALMEAQTARDQHNENKRVKFNEMRGKNCTNCGQKLHRGHFHVVGSGHSVCCTCVPKVNARRPLVSVFDPIKVRSKATMKGKR